MLRWAGRGNEGLMHGGYSGDAKLTPPLGLFASVDRAEWMTAAALRKWDRGSKFVRWDGWGGIRWRDESVELTAKQRPNIDWTNETSDEKPDDR